MCGNGINNETGKDKAGPGSARPEGPYWEDLVYRYLSRRHRSAAGAGDGPEAARFQALIEAMVNGAMPDEQYGDLEAEARADRKRRRQERKGRRKPSRAAGAEEAPSVNVADLKKRIFNPHVSRENVIKALEALPPAERKAAISGLPPGLRRKLGDYVKGDRR